MATLVRAVDQVQEGGPAEGDPVPVFIQVKPDVCHHELQALFLRLSHAGTTSGKHKQNCDI